MKNRSTNHSSDKRPKANREALNQEHADQQALLRSFEATRSPWWIGVSAGVLALGAIIANSATAGDVVLTAGLFVLKSDFLVDELFCQHRLSAKPLTPGG